MNMPYLWTSGADISFIKLIGNEMQVPQLMFEDPFKEKSITTYDDHGNYEGCNAQ